MINQMNPPMPHVKTEEPYPPYRSQYEMPVQAEYVPASRRRTSRTSRRTASPPAAASTAPSRRRHGYEEEDVEEESLPTSERRFFERCRREITSDVTYRQFLQLLDLFNRVCNKENESYLGCLVTHRALHFSHRLASPSSSCSFSTSYLSCSQRNQRRSSISGSNVFHRCPVLRLSLHGSRSMPVPDQLLRIMNCLHKYLDV